MERDWRLHRWKDFLQWDLPEEEEASFRQRDLRSEQAEQVVAGEGVLRRTDLWWEPEAAEEEAVEQTNRTSDQLVEREEILLQMDLESEQEVPVAEEPEQMNRASDQLVEREELLLQKDRRF